MRADRSLWYTGRRTAPDTIDEITADDWAGDYPAVQYVAPDGTVIDISSRLDAAFGFADIEATYPLSSGPS